MAESKLFKRQSGQIKAVSEESKEILEMAKTIAESVSSEPPPPPPPSRSKQRPKTPARPFVPPKKREEDEG